MKKIISALFILLGIFTLLSCANNEEGKFTEKDINLYEEKNKVSRTVKLRFYDYTPNIPYIGVSEFIKEFAELEYEPTIVNGVYKYVKNENCYAFFDAKTNMFTAKDHLGLCYLSTEIKDLFLGNMVTKTTKINEFVVDFDDYEIEFYHGNKDCYLPFALASMLFSLELDSKPSYNGSGIYMISDENGPDSYGSSYYTYLNSEEKRPEDIIKYNYNLLRFSFDRYRGYTKQLLFNDFNLESMGIDGILETYYPKIKELLLSDSYTNYKYGINALFFGLFDGGHTALASREFYTLSDEDTEAISDMDGLSDLYTAYSTKITLYNLNLATPAKLKAFGDSISKLDDNGKKTAKPFYYYYNDSYKIAYIAFDDFVTRYDLWKKYYNGDKSVANELNDKDTYMFVLNSIKKAKTDGANKIVFDFTTNNGGDSYALNGVFGILNGAKADFVTNYITEKRRVTRSYDVDINLDGKFDNSDVTMANELKNSFKIAILTSSKAFSCGNLFPSLMKENGFKVIGEKTGGGSCSLATESTVDGVIYYKSSFMTLSNKKGDNIDSGIEPDYKIVDEYGDMDYEKAFDLAFISNYLNSLE